MKNNLFIGDFALTTKFTKEELNNPDQIQSELRKGFVWTTHHSKTVIAAVGIFAVIGGGVSISSYFKNKKEVEVQEAYYSIEKSYLEKKRAFDEAASKKDAAKSASGDISKDYSEIPEKFEAFVKQSPMSHGAQMAALNVSDIYMNYGKLSEALAVLSSVEPGLSGSDSISALVYLKLGGIFADKNDCPKAITYWEKVSQAKTFSFAHGEAKLRMGLCYENMGQPEKAEQLFIEVSAKDNAGSDFGSAHDAEKYLKLIKAKKNLLGLGS